MTDITLFNCQLKPADGRTVPPIGLLWLASVLKTKGYHAEIRDYQLHDAAEAPNPSEIGSSLHNSSEIIGISCWTFFLPLALAIARNIKAYHSAKKVILGGIGPSAFPEEILSHYPYVDIIAIGEGEQTLVELMDKSLCQLEAIKGISFRDNCGCIHTTPPRPRSDLDMLPAPAYEKLNVDNYQTVAITTARGCPFDCTFCDASGYWGRRVTYRSVCNVVEEMAMLVQQYGQRRISLADDLFVVNRRRVFDFCNELDSRKLDIEWGCCGMIGLMDKQLMARMAESGCTRIVLAMEAGADRLLEKVRKRFRVVDALRTLEEAVEYFNHVQTNLLWGYPFETLEDFRDTLLASRRAYQVGAFPGITLLTPLPYSELTREYANSLVFDEAAQPYLLSDANIVAMAKDPWLLEAIKSHPRLFPCFYRFPSPDFERKLDMVRELLG